MIEPRMHAVAVVFDFMQPLVAVRRRVDQLGELRPDPLRQRGTISPGLYSCAMVTLHIKLIDDL